MHCLLFNDNNPWNYYLHRGIGLLGFCFLYPVLISSLTVAVGDIEHNANAWKFLFSQPFNKLNLVLAKLFLITFYFTFAYITNVFFYVLTAYSIAYLRPDVNFFAYQPNLLIYFLLVLKIYICLISVLVLHFWLGILFKNMFMLSIFLPITLMFSNLTIFPYNYAFKSYLQDFSLKAMEIATMKQKFNANHLVVFGSYEVMSMVFSTVFFYLAYYLFKNSRFV